MAIRKNDTMHTATEEVVINNGVEEATDGLSMGGNASLISGITDTGFDNKSSGVSKQLFEVFKKMVDKRVSGTYAVAFDTALYLSSEHDSTSSLAFDTVALIASCEGRIAVQCFFVVHTRQAPYDSRAVTLGDSKIYNVSSYPSDAHDPTFVKLITATMVARYKQSPENISVLNSKVLYPEWDIDQSAEDELIHSANMLQVELLMYVHGSVKDITLESIANTTGNAITVNVKKVTGNENVVDENGMAIAPNLMCSMNCLINNTQHAKKSMNRANSSVHIADAYVRTGMVYTGNADAVSAAFNASGKLPTEIKCFTPVLLIEDIYDKTPTLAKHLLMIAGTTALNSNNIIHSTITPEVLAHLNIRANISGSDSAGPLNVEDVKAGYHNALNDLLTDNLIVGIVVKPGTHYANYTKYWVNDGPMCSTIRAAANELTGGMFDDVLPIGRPLTVNHVEVMLSGTYTDDNGGSRPLSEIDIVHLLMTQPNQVALHDDWIQAQSTSDPLQATALKMSVIDALCLKGHIITDIQYVTYILGETLQALSICLAASNVNISTNAESIAPSINTTWAPHMASSAGFSPDKVAMSSLNNTAIGSHNFII